MLLELMELEGCQLSMEVKKVLMGVKKVLFLNPGGMSIIGS